MKRTMLLVILVLTCISVVNTSLAIATEQTSESTPIMPIPTPPNTTSTPTPTSTTPIPTPTPTSTTPIPTPTPTSTTPIPTQTITVIVKDNDVKDSGISSLAGSTVLSLSLANLDPNPPIAGEAVDIRIGIENIGGEDINDIMMEVIPEYPFYLVSGENAVKKVGIVEGYQSDDPTANLKIIKYKMRVDKDASAGIYELKVKYYESGESDFVTKSLYIDIKSRTNVEIIRVDKTALVPGKQDSLKFTINNVGNAPLKDITFNWENKDDAVLPVGSDNTRYIKYIDINEGFDLEYQVIADTNANPGLYKLVLYLTYIDSINGTRQQLATTAGVYIGGGTDFDVSFSDSTESETSFSIANTGSNPAYAVLIIIPRQKDWKVSGPNSVMIGNLNSGDYTSAGFKLQSSGKNIISDSNSSEITVKIMYTDTMGERKVIEKIVELEQSQNTITTNVGITKQRQGDPMLIIIIIIVILFLVSAYKKYGRQKLVDPGSKITDIFRSPKKKKFG